MISYQSIFSPKLKTVFLISVKAVSSLLLVVESVRSYRFARHITTWRRALKNIKEYLLGQVKLSQIHPLAVHCVRNDSQTASLLSISHNLGVLTYHRESY